MKHARMDYQMVQDLRGEIPENEPVFLLRAQDKLAPKTVDFWADEAQKAGVDIMMCNAARSQAIEMRRWQSEVKVKIPDVPERGVQICEYPDVRCPACHGRNLKERDRCSIVYRPPGADQSAGISSLSPAHLIDCLDCGTDFALSCQD